MTTAKERYYEFKGIADKYFEGLRDPIHDYVTELEQELAKLKESQTQKSIIKLCNRVDKAEAEKVELIKMLKDVLGYAGQDEFVEACHKASNLLNKHKDKTNAL